MTAKIETEQQSQYVTLQQHHNAVEEIIKLEEQNKIMQQQIQHLTELTEENTNTLTTIRIMQETERAIRKQDDEDTKTQISFQIAIISSICATIIAFLITNLIQII